jgi:N utilization substance protein A
VLFGPFFFRFIKNVIEEARGYVDMNNELLAVLDYIEQERGISRDVLIEAVEKALVSAARKGIHPAEDLTVKVDSGTGEITATAKLEVVEVFPNNNQIKLEEAQQTHPDAKIGDIIDWTVPPEAFGRIAAQTAKQAIMHRLRMAEKEIVRDEYIDKVGRIINGVVRRFESGNMIIDFGKAEGIMRSNDKVRGEQYVPGDRINALLVNVDITSSGPSLIVSRSTPQFVVRLFEREVTEIHDGTVKILGVAREAGNRTKIAVKSNDPRVDPVGACVGMRGMRVRNVTNELSGEKVDIIPYAEKIEDFAMNALSPAKAKRIDFNKETGTINVYVAPDQSRLAFGKKGQNVRLSAKLLGKSFKIFIEEEEHHNSLQDQKERAAASLSEHLGVSNEIAMTLVNNGFLSIDGLREAGPSALSEIDGLSAEDRDAVIDALK